MRSKIYFSTLALILFFNVGLLAQCSFTPTVALSPQVQGNIYCPNDMVELSTQVYDSYQWYYNFSNSNSGGTPVAGGNGQSIQLPAGQWAVVYFYVEATQGGCTEASATVVFDSWVFAGLAISHSPQMEWCEGQSTIISSAFPGPSIFQWYRDFSPIPGAEQSSYEVTQSGYYTLQAAYSFCPNYWLNSGVGPTFTFNTPIPPTISQVGQQLVAGSGSNFQWARNGSNLPGANGMSFTPTITGNYTVSVLDINNCPAVSAPFFWTDTQLSAELTKFEGRMEACEAHLSWQTETESNSAWFGIERSYDGVNFYEVQRVPAAGESLSKIEYNIVVEAVREDSYLRLKMMDMDGDYQYSDIIFLKSFCQNGMSGGFFLYPNPVENEVFIENDRRQNIVAHIFDMSGRLISEFPVTSEELVRLNTASLENGVYQIKVTGELSQATFKIIKL